MISALPKVKEVIKPKSEIIQPKQEEAKVTQDKAQVVVSNNSSSQKASDETMPDTPG